MVLLQSCNPTILQTLTLDPFPRSTKEALGDVIGRLAPFLKLYAHYTSGFEEAVKTLTDCTKKDRKFDSVVREFEVGATCGWGRFGVGVVWGGCGHWV